MLRVLFDETKGMSDVFFGGHSEPCNLNMRAAIATNQCAPAFRLCSTLRLLVLKHGDDGISDKHPAISHVSVLHSTCWTVAWKGRVLVLHLLGLIKRQALSTQTWGRIPIAPIESQLQRKCSRCYRSRDAIGKK